MRSSPRISSPCRGRRPRQAFTLIELVAVMGIILTMTLVVVGSYVGITRAIAARAGINHLSNAVMLARQHACMDGQRTYLYVVDETQYVLCRRAGVVTTGPLTKAEEGEYFTDGYSDLGSFVNSLNSNTNKLNRLRLFDLTLPTGTPFAVFNKAEFDVGIGWMAFFEPDPTFKPDPPAEIFAVGHSYGVELYPVRELPKGYTFKSERGFMYFEPSGASGGSLDKIEIIETIKPTLVQSVTVKNGKITVETAGVES